MVTSSAGGDTLNSNTVTFSVTSGSVLPVNMVNVKAYQKATGTVQVEWTTLTEINTERFEVERSTDGQIFTTVGSVSARGTNGVRENYNLLDHAPEQGSNYYRIKSIDKNGFVQYSNIIRVFVGKASGQVTAYPNPVINSTINLQFTNMEKGNYTVTLTNKLGQQTYHSVIRHNGGSTTQTLRINNSLTRGSYQLQVIGEEFNMTKQLIKD